MISVVVPVYKNAFLVEHCLERLVRSVPRSAEIIVVDDASDRETLEVVGKFDRVRLISHAANRGNTAAYNTGAQAAHGDVLVFVDSDVFVPMDCFEYFEQILSQDRSIGALGSLLLYPQDCTIQHVGIGIDRWSITHIYAGLPTTEITLQPCEEMQAVTAAFFACRKSNYQLVGGFDETYRDGLEDIDFCFKLKEIGLRNVVYTEIRAMHIESATRGSYKHIRRTFNYVIFSSRWHSKMKYDLDRYMERAASALPWPYPKGQLVEAVNFCTSPNWRDQIEVISRGRLTLSIPHDKSGFLADYETIDLYRTLPLAFQRLPIPIVFSVDGFRQLLPNRYWFRERPVLDIIVDRHANVVLSSRMAAT